MVHTENIDALLQRVALDLIDDYDEELELELEDRTDRDYLEGASAISSEDQKRYRREYFTNLFHLQSELVKLQDWIAHHYCPVKSRINSFGYAATLWGECIRLAEKLAARAFSRTR